MKSGKTGVCYLIGAGPGDPGLLTLRGRDCLARAEVVYYDFLAAEELLRYAPVEAELVCVGKAAGAHSVPQEQTTRLLVEAVQAGRIVARLKGGDPFVFGRGGEEALALAEAGLAFEVVPGVTSAVAAAAYAGIPVTHRGLSTAVTLVTGHESPEKLLSQTDWQALARGGQTICVYMGMANLAFIAGELLRFGRPPEEPVAVVRQGTCAGQRTITGTLADIAGRVALAQLEPPAMILIGAVVGLRDSLNWFERRPLFGRRIVVTRSREQAGALSVLLQTQGAQVLEMPALRVEPVALDCPEPLRELLSKTRRVDSRYYGSSGRQLGLDCGNPGHLRLLDACDSLTRGLALIAGGWPDYVVFTSVNGVEHAFERLAQLGWDARVFGHCRMAVIGPATADALRQHGVEPDLVPRTFTGEGLLAALRASAELAEETSILAAGGGRSGVRDRRFVLLRAENARDLLPEALTEAGAMVEDLVAYRAHPVPLSEENRTLLVGGGIDAVTFASSGTVRNFMQALGGDRSVLLGAERRALFASIGPVTSETMRELGLPVDVEAAEATIPSLADAVMQALRRS